MGCKVSTETVSARSKGENPRLGHDQQLESFALANDHRRLWKGISRRDSFIHEMLRPQLDPSVPPIGVRGCSAGPGQPQHRHRASDQSSDALLADTASVESCLARVITLRNEIIQQNQLNQQQNGSGQPMTMENNGGQQQNNRSQPSISSFASDISPSSAGGPVLPRHHICGTTVTFEWLFHRIVEKFKCTGEPEPQWIVEKLNDIGDKDLDRTIVLRITFGWENAKLPKSVVLKICERREEDNVEESKLASALFKRECQTYEWLSKQKRMVIPRIFVIKKQWSKSCNALIVMEDLSDCAMTGELGDEIGVEGLRDLLRNLAQLHALTMVQGEEWRKALGGAAANASNAQQFPAFFFQQIEQFARAVSSQAGAKLNLDIFKNLEPWLSAGVMERLVNESCTQLDLPECLLHGQPLMRNVFFRDNSNRRNSSQQQKDNAQDKEAGPPKTIQALIDWTQAHNGCFGEDLAKSICWNLPRAEREPDQILKLLQYYHYQILRKLQFYGASQELQKSITFEKVTKAYERFVPLCAVAYLLFLPEDLNHADAAVLERAQQLVGETISQQTQEKQKEEVDLNGTK